MKIILHIFGGDSLFVIITYDVAVTSKGGEKRLRDVAKYCENIGQRVQNSVFECLLDYAKYKKVKSDLADIIDVELDSVRFYNLGNKWNNKVVHIGTVESFNLESGTLIL